MQIRPVLTEISKKVLPESSFFFYKKPPFFNSLKSRDFPQIEKRMRQVMNFNALLADGDFCRTKSNGVARTLIKWRLLDQAVILFNCVHFHNGTSLVGKNLLPGGGGGDFFP